MKRSIAAMTLLVVAAAGAAVAYQAAARQRDYSALLTHGDLALRDEQTAAAIEDYSGAIALRPGSMLAYLRRGQTYQRRGDRGDLEAAVRDFRRAAALDPTATRPLEALGDALYQLQRYDRAGDACERSVRLDDRSARVSYKLALALSQPRLRCGVDGPRRRRSASTTRSPTRTTCSGCACARRDGPPTRSAPSNAPCRSSPASSRPARSWRKCAATGRRGEQLEAAGPRRPRSRPRRAAGGDRHGTPAAAAGISRS